MKRNELLYAIIGFFVGGVFVWLITVNAVSSNYAPVMRMMGIRQPAGQNATGMSNTIDPGSIGVDRLFIEQMIPHHEDAITMAKLALTNAKRAEVKELATNIIDSQGKEIEQMKVWYQEWFGTNLPTGEEVMSSHGMMGGSSMHMGMMGNESDITRLEQASDFDREFVEEMIPHHQMAVMMANMLKNATQRPEMRKLADDIIAAQTREINMMRGWLNEWK